jgi:hypothetical protein
MMMQMQFPTGVRRRWTSEDDAKLTSARTNTPKKKFGKEYQTDWVAIAVLVPGLTRRQCCDRWKVAFDPRTDRTPERSDRWTIDEDGKLNDAVQMHGDKDWVAISALVPSRTKNQCYKRWHDAFDPRVDRATARTGK